MRPAAIPTLVLTYGLLGLIPFLTPPLVGWLLPQARPAAVLVLGLYAGLILSFLGGARWGLAIKATSPPALEVSLAMLPTLAGLALLLLPAGFDQIRLFGLALALAAHWLWDLRGADLPPWYGRLRTMLSAGAVAGLLGGAFLLT